VDADTARMDLNFYVVALQRLREVARMARDRLHLQPAAQALELFDKKWPRFRELRNLEEHVLGPSLNAPEGIYYFGRFVADLQPDGKVEYIVDVIKTEPDIEQLYISLCMALAERENELASQ
jgi:hypothetical protein